MLHSSINDHIDNDITLMEANLLQLQREITERSDEFDEELSSSHLRKNSANNQLTSLRHRQSISLPNAIREHYQQYLKRQSLPENYEEKIDYLIQHSVSIGNSIALFQMVYYFKQALKHEILMEISNKYFEGFINAKNDEELICYGQLLAQCGVENQQICQHIAELLVQQKLNFDLGFLILSNQGETGLIYLFDIANRDIISVSHKILDYLCRTQSIINSLIVPLLIEDITSLSNTKYKDVALCILNRLGPIISNQNILQGLTGLLFDSSIDKKILLATIRSIGLQGQKILIDIITSKKYSENIVALALSVLSWRIPTKMALRLKVIEFTIENCFLPGRLYQYQGQVEPWSFSSQDTCTDSLCLSSRDFIAHLQVFIKQGNFKHYFKTNNIHLFTLIDVLNLYEQQNAQISEEIVRVLTHQIRGKSVKIKEIGLIQLGNIGKPEASSAIEAVSNCLYDQDSSIRSAACWTISRICIEPTRKLQIRLGQLVKDHFWKVRTSACITLGLIIEQPLNSTVQLMLKSLQDGSIPKSTVCQTLVRMGIQYILLQILRDSNKSDFKLREAIISSFQFSSLRPSLVNSIVEQLLRYSRDNRIQTRELCLMIINSLRKKVEAKGGQSISYFQTKNLLPFYYCFLDDPSQKIRTLAAENILSFGSQSELVFIQGMTKGQPLAKIQCIKCLGKLGVQNFRALILGLRDQDQRVKRAACQTILSSFTVQQIIDQFKNRENHTLSLICNLTEVLKNPQKNEQLKAYFKQIIIGLEEVKKKGVIRDYNQNIRVN